MPKTVVAIGEALWDLFPDQRRPGGAPCNVACHAALLGDRGVIITRVGEDAAGEELVAFLRGRGVVTDYVQRDEARPTGTVSVTIEDSDPRYAIAEDVAWDRIAARDESARSRSDGSRAARPSADSCQTRTARHSSSSM
jgi:fructokinase